MSTTPRVCALFENLPRDLQRTARMGQNEGVTLRFSFYLASNMIPVLPTFKWEISSLPQHWAPFISASQFEADF